MVTAENAERRPLTTTGALKTNSPSTTIPNASDVAALLALSDERDLWLRRLAAAFREGFAAGYELGAADGRRQVLAEEEAAQHAAAIHLLDAGQAEADRWEVRGQRRTRATFSQPHKADHPDPRRGAA